MNKPKNIPKINNTTRFKTRSRYDICCEFWSVSYYWFLYTNASHLRPRTESWQFQKLIRFQFILFYPWTSISFLGLLWIPRCSFSNLLDPPGYKNATRISIDLLPQANSLTCSLLKWIGMGTNRNVINLHVFINSISLISGNDFKST